MLKSTRYECDFVQSSKATKMQQPRSLYVHEFIIKPSRVNEVNIKKLRSTKERQNERMITHENVAAMTLERPLRPLTSVQ